jgi:hypothetical protein
MLVEEELKGKLDIIIKEKEFIARVTFARSDDVDA